MTKFVSSEGAAYDVAVDVTDAEEAAKLGLAVVEVAVVGGGTAPRYGRYKDAPKGAPLGVTVAKAADTEVIGGGAVSPATGTGATTKGGVLPPDDPIARPTGDDSVHVDGAAPATVGATDEQVAEAVRLAEQSLEEAGKARKK